MTLLSLSASVRSLLCVFYGANPCMKCSLVPPIFLKRSVVFPILLSSSTSLHCSLKKTFSSLIFSETLHSVGCIFPFLPCLSLLFFAWLFVKPPQPLCLLAFFFWMDFVITSATMLQTSLHSSSGTLSTRFNPLNSICHLHCMIIGI